MSLDSDVALIGTGVAPLIAASLLASRDKKVVVLNPDWDFFREDSELPFDPLWPIHSEVLSPDRIQQSVPQRAIDQLRPDFPGAIEYWDTGEVLDPSSDSTGFYDMQAPHVRLRNRLWIRSDRDLKEEKDVRAWSSLEEMYLKTSDEGLRPEVLEGISAVKPFPGFSGSPQSISQRVRAIQMPRMCDVDVGRFRNGLLEYICERIGLDRVICSASQIELKPHGIRFLAKNESKTENISLTEGSLVFWTPRMTQWIRNQIQFDLVKELLKERGPQNVRVWELWLLLSRDALDPKNIGVFEDMTVWSTFEGGKADYAKNKNHLAVLKAGEQRSIDAFDEAGVAQNWASSDSFASLSRLCHLFLSWDKFSVLSMKPRILFEWGSSTDEMEKLLPVSHHHYMSSVVTHADGPLVEVAKTARHAALRYL